MAVTDVKVHPRSQLARKEYTIAVLPGGTGLTDAVIADFLPGFDGEVVGVQWFARQQTGAVTVKLRKGGVNFAGGTTVMTDIVSAQATAVAATLAATLAARRFTKADRFRVGVTTDGTGALASGGTLVIVVRPRPQNGEAL